MAMDLSAPGSHVIAGAGGGTSPSDALVQSVQDLASETALGAPSDPAYDGLNSASVIALLKAVLAALGGAPVIITAAGTVAVDPAWTSIVWQPTGAGTVTFVLPAVPQIGEQHAFKNYSNISGAVLQITGGEIDGNPSYVLVTPYDTVSLKYIGGGQWAIMS